MMPSLAQHARAASRAIDVMELALGMIPVPYPRDWTRADHRGMTATASTRGRRHVVSSSRMSSDDRAGSGESSAAEPPATPCAKAS